MNLNRFCRIPAIICFFAAFILIPFALQAQDVSDAEDGENTEESEVALPRQFREITLGMNIDDLKTALQNDSLFDFRGDRDVSFLPVREESLVETTGSSFVRRAFFQLRDGSLFIMSLTLNTGLIDYHSMFTELVEKYGQPVSLNPREVVWETEETRLTLERPLTVKYIDLKVFNDIISESSLIQSRRVQDRQDFLNEF